MHKSLAISLAVLSFACTATSDEPADTSSEAITRGSLLPGLVTGRIYDDLAAHTEERMADFDALGVRAIRMEIEVDMPIDAYRRIADAAAKHGIRVLALFTSNSMRGPNDPMAGDIDRFDREFVPAYMMSIDRVLEAIPSIEHIEVWNEPDVFGFTPMFHWTPQACTREEGSTRYALLATRVFETLSERRKRGEKTPKMAAFSFSRQDDDCLRSAVVDAEPIRNHRRYYRPQANLGDGLPTDIVAIHGYGNAGHIPGEAGYAYGGGTFADAVSEFLSARFADGRPIIGGAPVWYTEVGVCRGGTGGANPRARQATAITRTFATLRKHPEVQATFVYAYRDDEDGGTEECGLRASSKGDYAEQPAYSAYRAAAK